MPDRSARSCFAVFVCQNQSIDESDADLGARSARPRSRAAAGGDSDGQVVDYVVSRYGDFVLLRPPLKPATYALWFGPVLDSGMRRRRHGLVLPTEVSPAKTQKRVDVADEERLARVLEESKE